MSGLLRHWLGLQVLNPAAQFPSEQSAAVAGRDKEVKSIKERQREQQPKFHLARSCVRPDGAATGDSAGDASVVDAG